MTGRAGALAAMAITAVVLTTVVAPTFALGAVRPDLVLLTVVLVALADGSTVGARYGFSVGLLSDLVSGGDQLVGVGAFVLLVVGYLVGVTRPYLASSELVAQVATVVGATVLAVCAQGLLAVLLGTSTVSAGSLFATALGAALYHVLLIPVLLRPVAALHRRVAGPTADAAR